MQPSLLQYFKGRETKPTMFVDLFCGAGGASAGAAAAGLSVVLAVDAWDKAIACHALNHPDATHMCMTLPPKDPLPLPPDGSRWHLHGSPPCTIVSKANQLRDPQRRKDAVALIKWFIDFALESSCTTWSLEQVASPIVMELIESYKNIDAPHRAKIDYEVFNFVNLGVPQPRRRLIAGSATVVARLRRAPRVHRSVRDVITKPRGTHVRNQVRRANNESPKIVDGKRVYTYKWCVDDDYCKPISGPAHVVVAAYKLRWARPGTGTKFKLFNTRESAALQCFPENYKFPKESSLSIKLIGNALPPTIMQQMLG